MRTLNRNKREIWYRQLIGMEVPHDEYGNENGDRPVYGKPVRMFANVGAARGSAEADMFGVNVNYSRAIVTDKTDCPINEDSILYVLNMPVFDENGDTKTPHDHVVVQVAKSINSIVYAVRQVDVSVPTE